MALKEPPDPLGGLAGPGAGEADGKAEDVGDELATLWMGADETGALEDALTEGAATKDIETGCEDERWSFSGAITLVTDSDGDETGGELVMTAEGEETGEAGAEEAKTAAKEE